MRLARTPRQRFPSWRIFVLLLCILVPNYFLAEMLELDGSNDEDSDAEALVCAGELSAPGAARRREPPLTPHHDATSLPDPLLGFFSALNRWTTAAKLRLVGGARTAVLRAIASCHLLTPLTAFAALGSPAADPA
jgi:hypothetical protein